MTELEGETLFYIDAKIGGNSKKKEILYTFIEPLNSYYLKKTEIYLAQIQACKNLTKYNRSNEETQIINNEISHLQFTLSLEAP